MSKEHQIVMRAVADLKPAMRNARTHSKKQIAKLTASLTQFGFVTPILIDADRRIVAGHGRLQAAIKVGITSVPTLTLAKSPAELRAYAIADNEIAAQAGWDRELLALEIAEIELLMPELDLTITGFEIEQIEILRDVKNTKCDPDTREELPDVTGPAVTRLGDLWEIADGRLLCGDALQAASYERLLCGKKADLVISDLPYNVRISGNVTSKVSSREFEMASGEMSRPQFQRFLSQACQQLARHSRNGSLHYLFMDWRSIADLIEAGEEHYTELLNLIVWAKPVGGMGSLYRSRHELVALFRNGRRAHINNVQLGANGRNRTNVWEYAGMAGFGGERALSALHPTVKNSAMIADAICDGSNAGDVILDSFSGSGTTLIAAQRTGRVSRLIELDPLYCDVTIRRGLAEGMSARCAVTGQTFEEIASRRTESTSASTQLIR